MECVVWTLFNIRRIGRYLYSRKVVSASRTEPSKGHLRYFFCVGLRGLPKGCRPFLNENDGQCGQSPGLYRIDLFGHVRNSVGR